MFFNRFWPKSNWSTKHFLFDLNLELHSGLKVRGSEINFINKKLLKSKNPRGFVIPVLKVEVTNPRGFFDSSNFLLIKLISDPLTLRPLCSSRFRLNKKCLADQLLLGQNLLKNVLNRKTFLNWRPLAFIEHYWGFTHETEKDKTGNVFLGVTKLGKTKLGIWFAENLFCEIPTFMANSKISKYEKFKN